MNAPSLARLVPASSWLRAYEVSWLRADVFAGITLAAYLLPAGLGDASLANLPPEAGLYACLFGGLVFWLFCSSRHTVVTVTSAISLLVGASVASLFKLSTLKQLWRVDRAEFVVAMAAILGVLSSGLLRGVMIGAIISLVQLLRTASRPHVAFLGRIPGSRRFSDRERHLDNELISGALIFRPESGLVYFNVDHVCESILKRVHAEPTPPKLVVLDLSAAPRLDLQSAHALAGMADELTAQRIRFQAVEARSSVRDRLRNEGVDSKFGNINRFKSVADAIEDFQKTSDQ